MKANSPGVLTAIFLVSVILVQYVLRNALPNLGLGGAFLIFVGWPALLIWISVFYMAAHFVRRLRTRFLIANIVIMTLLAVAIYPQDSAINFVEKIQAIGGWIS